MERFAMELCRAGLVAMTMVAANNAPRTPRLCALRKNVLMESIIAAVPTAMMLAVHDYVVRMSYHKHIFILTKFFQYH